MGQIIISSLIYTFLNINLHTGKTFALNILECIHGHSKFKWFFGCYVEGNDTILRDE